MGYNPSVRKGLAALLFVLIAGLAAADPLVCPDGCTKTGGAGSGHEGAPVQPSGACLICQHGTSPALQVITPASPLVITEPARPTAAHPVSGVPASIEHPPD